VKKSSLTVGIDVPWVTSWTEEPIQGVARCASVGGRLALTQTERAGYGRPEYSKNHLLRQRLSVSRMLCPMCGEPTSPDDRVTQVARRIPAGRLRASGRGTALSPRIADEQILVDAGAIAPLHGRCSERSLEHCPHLRAEPAVDVQPFPGRWAILPLLIEATTMAASGQAHLLTVEAPISVAVITFLQLCGISDQIDRAWRTRRKSA